MTTAPDIEQAILDRLAAGVHQRLANLPAEQAAQVDPDWVAAAMLDAIPTQHPFAALGPFYDTAALVRWLGITRQALHQKVKGRQVLACTTGDGQRVYPAWQFSPDGRPLSGLAEVLDILLRATDPWTAAIWLTTPHRRLSEKSAVEWLRTGPDVAGVAAAAAATDASRWAE